MYAETMIDDARGDMWNATSFAALSAGTLMVADGPAPLQLATLKTITERAASRHMLLIVATAVLQVLMIWPPSLD
jgi:hypothetical protein